MTERTTRGSRLRAAPMTLVLALSLVVLVVIGWRTGFGGEKEPADASGLVRAGKDKKGAWVLKAYGDDSAHKPLEKARAGDWRRGPGKSEKPQTFLAYMSGSPIKATAERKKIVLQPLGKFDDRQKKMLVHMQAYAAAFFGCEVVLKKAIDLPKKGQRTRSDDGRKWTQHLTKSIMDTVLQPRLPKDAICYLGITMEDLYPQASWNYVFGQAYLHRRTGVYSFARYFAEFWGQKETDATRLVALKRACKVLAHETGHMFSIDHCLHYSCTMNGSNNLPESDRQPIWLCPVCVSKLTWNRGFEPIARYDKLGKWFGKVGLKDEAAWYGKQVETLRKRKR